MEGHRDNSWSSPHWSARRENRDSGGRGGGYAGGRGNPRDGSSGYQRQNNHFGNRHQQSQYYSERSSLNRGHQGRQHSSSYGQREGPGSQQYSQQYRNFPQQEHPPFIGFGASPPPQFDAHSGPAENRAPEYMPYGHGPEPPFVPVPQRAPDYWNPQPHGAAAAYPYHAGAPHGIPAPYPQPPFPSDQQPAQQYMQALNTGDFRPPAAHAAGPAGPPPQAPVPNPGYNAPPQRSMAPPTGAWSQGTAAARGPEPGRAAVAGAGAGGSRKGALRPPHVPQPLPVSASSSQEPPSSGMNSLGRPRQRPSSTLITAQGSRSSPQSPPAQPQTVKDYPEGPQSQSSFAIDEAATVSDASGAGKDLGHISCSQDATQMQAPTDATTAREGGSGVVDAPATGVTIATMATEGKAHTIPAADVRVPSGPQHAGLTVGTPGTPSKQSDHATAVGPVAAAAPAAINHQQQHPHSGAPSPSTSTSQVNEACAAGGMAASSTISDATLPAGPQGAEFCGSAGEDASTAETGASSAVPVASSPAMQQQHQAHSQVQAAKPAASGSAWKQRPAIALFSSPTPNAPAATAARQAAVAAIDGRAPVGVTAPAAVATASAAAATARPVAARVNNRPPPVDVTHPHPAPGHTRPPGPPPGFDVPQLPITPPSTTEASATGGPSLPSAVGIVSPSGRGSSATNGVLGNHHDEHPPQQQQQPRAKAQQQLQRQQPVSPGKYAEEASVQGAGSAVQVAAQPPYQPSQLHRVLTGSSDAGGGGASGPVSPSAEEVAAAPLTNWAAVLARNASGPPPARSLRSTGSGGGARVTAPSPATGTQHPAPGSSAAATLVSSHVTSDATSPSGGPMTLATAQAIQAAAFGPAPAPGRAPTPLSVAPISVNAVAPVSLDRVPHASERPTHAVPEAVPLPAAAVAEASVSRPGAVVSPAVEGVPAAVVQEALLPPVVSVDAVDVGQASAAPAVAGGVGEASQPLPQRTGSDTPTDGVAALATDTVLAAGGAAAAAAVDASSLPSPGAAAAQMTAAAPAPATSEPTPAASAAATPAAPPALPSGPSSWAAIASKTSAAAARPGPRVAAAQGASPGGRGLGGGRHTTAPHGRAPTLPPEELFRHPTVPVAVAASAAGSNIAAASLSLSAVNEVASIASARPEAASSVHADATTSLEASLSGTVLSVSDGSPSAAAAAPIDASTQLAAVTVPVQADPSGHEPAAQEHPPHALRDTEWHDVHSRAKGGKGSGGVSAAVQHPAQPGGAAGRGRGRHGEAVRPGPGSTHTSAVASSSGVGNSGGGISTAGRGQQQQQPQSRQAQGRGQGDKQRQDPHMLQQHKQGHHPPQEHGQGDEQPQVGGVPVAAAASGPRPLSSPGTPNRVGAAASAGKAALPTAVAATVENAAAAVPSEPPVAAVAAETPEFNAGVQEEVARATSDTTGPAGAPAAIASAVVTSEVPAAAAVLAASGVVVAAGQLRGRKAVAEKLNVKDDDEEEDAAGAIPAGRNPWDLLGAAGEDGDVTSAATVTLAAAATTANAAALSTSASDAMEALRQLLSPAALAAADTTGRHLLMPGGGGAVHIQPRGLVNTGNTCFINSTMQALLACAPFAAVLSRLPSVAPLLEPSKSPTLHGLALFSAELAAASPAGTAAGGGGGTASGGGGSPADLPIMEEDGWAQVATGRGKKGGSSRKSISTYPALHAHAAIHTAASNAAVSAATGAANPSATPPGAAGPSATPPAVLLGGRPLVPTMLNGIVAAFNPRISFTPSAVPGAGPSGAKPSMAQMLSKGGGSARGLLEQQEQQDAQEFFQFLVNRAHEEVVALRKAHGLGGGGQGRGGSGGGGGGSNSGGGASGGADGEEWAQVGRKNKATVTRQVGTPSDDAASRSPVSAIFSGLLKSTVRFSPPHSHYKPSATIEAFNMLHLDIAPDGVASLEDALRAHALPESIEYKPDGAPGNVPAKKDVRLYRLPEVLVLHLKRFTISAAGGGGYCKLHKPVAFATALKLEGKVLAEDCPDRANSEYRLFATVVHHGRSIAGGHYTADVLLPDGRWLRFNDAVVDAVNEAAVLAERPYLLFYQRCAAPGTAGAAAGRSV